MKETTTEKKSKKVHWIKATDRNELHRYRVRIYNELSKSPTAKFESIWEKIKGTVTEAVSILQKESRKPNKH